MALKNTEIKVGAVVVIAAVIFILSLLWVKDYGLDGHRYELTVTFPTVGGLTAGDRVRVAGVRMGDVKEIRLRATDVLVTLSMNDQVQLSADSQIFIRELGLMGEKFVSIEPGSDPAPLALDQPVMGHYQESIFEVLDGVGELLQQIQAVVSTINQVVGNPEAQASIQESLENIRKFSRVLADLLDQQGGDMVGALRDLRSASRGFSDLVVANRSRIDSTIDQVHQVSTDLVKLTRQLAEVSGTFKRITDKIERGEGTLGEFVQDETLYRDMKKTVKNLDELILDIKENPHRYLRLEIF